MVLKSDFKITNSVQSMRKFQRFLLVLGSVPAVKALGTDTIKWIGKKLRKQKQEERLA